MFHALRASTLLGIGMAFLGAACASAGESEPGSTVDQATRAALPAHVRIQSDQRIRVPNADTMFLLLAGEVYEVEPRYDVQAFPDVWRIRIVETGGFVRRAGVAATYAGTISPPAQTLEAVRQARRRAANRVQCEMQGSRDLETMAALDELYTSEYVLRAFRANGESTIRYSDIEAQTRPDRVHDGFPPADPCAVDEAAYPDDAA